MLRYSSKIGTEFEWYYINGTFITKEIRDTLGDIIIQHLLKKKDHKDDLEGISIFVYEKELENLSGEIMSTIGDLVAKGLLKVSENSVGQKKYQLSNSHS